MNIHIWFNKCQLLIYMSVGKRRQRGANSAGHNWASNSQLAWSSRPVHRRNRALTVTGAGTGLQGRPCTLQGASALRPLPARRRQPAIPSGNPTGINANCDLQVDPRVTFEPHTLLLCEAVSPEGSRPVCNQSSTPGTV